MKISILILVIVLSGFGLKAQYRKGQSPEHHSTGMVQTLRSRLNLTDQQTGKVMQIYLNHYRSRDSLKNIIVRRGPNPQAINSALTSMILARQLETDKRINSVLNNDQKAAYAKFVSSRKMGGIETVATPAQ